MNDGGNILRSLINMLNAKTLLSIKLVLLNILFMVQLCTHIKLPSSDISFLFFRREFDLLARVYSDFE